MRLSHVVPRSRGLSLGGTWPTRRQLVATGSLLPKFELASRSSMHFLARLDESRTVSVQGGCSDRAAHARRREPTLLGTRGAIPRRGSAAGSGVSVAGTRLSAGQMRTCTHSSL